MPEISAKASGYCSTTMVNGNPVEVSANWAGRIRTDVSLWCDFAMLNGFAGVVARLLQPVERLRVDPDNIVSLTRHVPDTDEYLSLQIKRDGLVPTGLFQVTFPQIDRGLGVLAVAPVNGQTFVEGHVRAPQGSRLDLIMSRGLGGSINIITA